MLNGKVAVVTGASRGIGRQIAISMAKEGAVVIVNYNGSAAKAEDVVRKLPRRADRRKPFSAMFRITARRRCS